MQNLPVVVLFIIAVVNAFLSLFVLISVETVAKLIYSLFLLAISLWSVGLGFFYLSHDLEYSLLVANFYYLAAAAIPALFLIFSKIFPRVNWGKREMALSFGPFFLLIILFILDKTYIVKKVFFTLSGKDVILDLNHYLYYSLYFISYILWAYFNLIISYRNSTDLTEKLQLRFILVGTAIAYVLGMYFNLLLPALGNYQNIWLGPVFTLCMVVSIAYAMSKHHLFNAKIIATELLTAFLCFFLLVRTLLSADLSDAIVNIIVLSAAAIFSVLLIKSVTKEIKNRLKIEQLAKKLESANEKLREVDRQKSEFVSIATHQLRSPLTAIKGYSSMILEGSFGSMSENLREAVDKIFKSSQSLVIVIDNFLNISRVEQGRMRYEFSEVDVGELAQAAIDQLMPNISAKGLTIQFAKDEGAKYIVRADKEKIRQVILNILDNSVKYTAKGGIEMDIRQDEDKICLSVSDTGLGMSKETIAKLFLKFVRADGATKLNPSGAGLGMYLACQIMKAHGGKIYALSKGKDMGSRFILEFDLKWKNEPDKQSSPNR